MSAVRVTARVLLSAPTETKETLRFAEMARAITNTPVVNREPKDELIHRLQLQVAELQDHLKTARQEGGRAAAEEVLTQLNAVEAALADLQEEKVGGGVTAQQGWHHFSGRLPVHRLSHLEMCRCESAGHQQRIYLLPPSSAHCVMTRDHECICDRGCDHVHARVCRRFRRLPGRQRRPR